MTPPSTPSSGTPTVVRRFLAWARSLVIALAIWFVISSLLVQAYHIPSGSMERSLLIGDVLFVNKALYGAEVPLLHQHLPAVREPRHGEIVVFQSPIEDLLVVKRLAGLPGDTLAMKDGRLFRNGRLVPEPYMTLASAAPPTDPATTARMLAWQKPWLLPQVGPDYTPDPHNWGPLVVPPGQVLTLGDNRDESFDGRFYGFVPRVNLRGTPLFIYYSYDPGSWRPLPWLTAIRWNRLGTVPH